MTPSLKGITSTNDDPNLCAICSVPFPTSCRFADDACVVQFCCGTKTCRDCFKDWKKEAQADLSTGRHPCFSCNADLARSPEILKKRAKKGAPWAQFWLGECYFSGYFMAQSAFDAVRWHRKAAAQGHPGAYLRLGQHCFRGDGCAEDLSEAQKHAEKAMLLDGNLVDDDHELLVGIGVRYRMMNSEKAIEQAKVILTTLAEAGVGDAQHKLGVLYHEMGVFSKAKQWFIAATLQGGAVAAFSTFVCCNDLGNSAQSRYWLEIATKRENQLTIENKQKRLNEMNKAWAMFRDLRNYCGGCGAALDGDMRKICKQCKTFCYCGHECQKLHWNWRGEDGHRDDCMEVIVLKEKMRAEKRSS